MTASTAHTHHSGRLTCSGSVRETLLVVPVMARGHITVIFYKPKLTKRTGLYHVLSFASLQTIVVLLYFVDAK